MKKEAFINSRQRLLDKLDDNSLVVLFAGKAPKKTADEKYAFTPNRNFYYLTGIDEEDPILMISKVDGVVEEVIFIKRPDLELEKWIGKSIREDEARGGAGIDKVQYLDELKTSLHQKLNGGKVESLYLDLERDSFDQLDTVSHKFAKEVVEKYPQIRVRNVYHQVAEQRMIKTEDEVQEMKKAIEITIGGVNLLMANSKPGMKENELEAYFDFHCKQKGSKDFAFKTIAAAGVNATILHYVDNNSDIKDGDLILFDLGAQYNYYNADITRTFPANGKFTQRQKEVYEAVLRVNEAVIAMMKPGVKFTDINNKATELIGEECVKLGLIKDKSEVRKYYWHSIGHSLGLDTHDTGNRNTELKPGMVFTVEPGIYIEEEAIGIRIEDDVLITEDGCENLTKDMIKSVEDIENFMAHRS